MMHTTLRKCWASTYTAPTAVPRDRQHRDHYPTALPSGHHLQKLFQQTKELWLHEGQSDPPEAVGGPLLRPFLVSLRIPVQPSPAMDEDVKTSGEQLCSFSKMCVNFG